MRKWHFIFVIIPFIIVSCCDDQVEIARFELTQNEKGLIPYTLDQNITFIHSNGHEFDFNVTVNEIKWLEHHDFCEWSCCGQEYFSYQQKTVKLESVYPIINISLYLGGDLWGEYYPDMLFVEFNRNEVSFPFDNETKFICDTLTKTEHFDSLFFGDMMYYDVYMKDFDSNHFADTSVLNAKTLFYNSIGILQIKMTNDETFTIKN